MKMKKERTKISIIVQTDTAEFYLLDLQDTSNAPKEKFNYDTGKKKYIL